jgi:hypothetical protein
VTVDRAAIGRSNRSRGAQTERDVAKALTRSGLPSRRHVRAGTRFEHDEGDLRLTVAPVTIEVKNWKGGYPLGQVAELLSKLDRQKRAGDLGLLVCKRSGVADPYGWYCYTTAYDAVQLMIDRDTHEWDTHGLSMPDRPAAFEHPVCFVFGDVIRALVSGGWVTEITNPFENLETS